MARQTKATEYLRHNLTAEERLTMGSELAAAHNTMSAIEEEENRIKATFKERKASVEQKIGQLSRELGSGFTMHNVDCDLVYDSPNIGEVSYIRKDNGELSYIRKDNGELVKMRPMSISERQEEIKFDEPVAINAQKPEETEENIALVFPGAVEAEPPKEHARQAMITMGDAKRGKKKKETAEEPSDSKSDSMEVSF